MKQSVNDFTLVEEIWHAVSHGFGLFLSTFGFGVLVTLAALSGDPARILTGTLYGIVLILMYGASTLYHAIPHPRAKSLLQQLDHAAIYLLIAGTYTPVTILGVQGRVGWVMFGTIWCAAAVGIFLKFVYPGRFELFSLILYAGMGWFIIFAWHPFVEHAGWLPMIFLFAGGAVYTLGILFYVRSSMRLNHAVWHLFVLGGSIFHYFTVFLLIRQT
ncbi:PAQR family membrane homeostasis protein TrhA [Hydrogenimonas sp.]